MSFNKIDRAAAFNPIAAFPLDAREYFDSKETAEAAAETACEVGSNESQYYIGQTLLVKDGDKIKFYTIQPDNSIKIVTDAMEADELTVTTLRAGALTVGNMVGEGSDYVQLPKLKVAGDIIAAGGDTNNSISGDAFIHGNNNTVGAKGYYIAKLELPNTTDKTCKIYLANDDKQVTLDDLKLLGYPNRASQYFRTGLSSLFTAGEALEIVCDKRWWDFTVNMVGNDYLVLNVSDRFCEVITAENTTFTAYKTYKAEDGDKIWQDEFSIFKKDNPGWGPVSLKMQGNAFGGSNSSVGHYSCTFGTHNKAYGEYAFVQGRNSEGRYNNFIAGSYCKGFKDSCFVQGYQNEAHGDISFVAGWGNIVRGRTGIITGYDNESSATDEASFITGYGNRVFTTGSSVVAGKDNNVGTASTASALSVVLGQKNTITGYHTDNGYGGVVVLGHQHTADASKSFSIIAGGRNNTVNNYYAAVLGGNQNIASGWYSTILGGTYSTVSGSSSAILGGGQSNTLKNTVSGNRSAIIAGQDNIVTSNEAFATGNGITVGGSSAAAFGTKNSVYGFNSFIAGNSSNKASAKISGLTNSGQNSTIDSTFAADKTFHIVYGGSSASIGYDNCITADYSYTLGEKNHIKTASNHSIAIGLNNTISSTGAFVAGKDNNHSNTDSAYSVIFGESNEINSAKCSLTFGFDCSNNSYYGLVGGYKSSNSKSNYSIAFGNNCKANGGEGSVAFGNNTTTSAKYQMVIGRFNDNTENTDALFVVGNGTSTSAKKNLFVVQPTAATMNGSFNVTGATTTASLKVNGTAEFSSIKLTGSLTDGTGKSFMINFIDTPTETGAIPVWDAAQGKFITKTIAVNPSF